MRLVSYQGEHGVCAGVQVVERVLDAGALLGEMPMGARRLIEEGRLAELAELAKLEDDVEQANVVRLLPPIPDPEKIICIGLNYRSHAAEAGIDPPEQPTFFAKFRNALAPNGATVPLPAASSKVDYEAEVAFVVGRECSGVEEVEAGEYVAGYMLLNDL